MFYTANEALSAISDKSKSFHVAIVEVLNLNSRIKLIVLLASTGSICCYILLQVRADNEDGRFKFLESAKELPTISMLHEPLI